MGRKTWVKPMTLVQKFEANEPVAAGNCYSIICESTFKWNHQDSSAPNPNAWSAKEGNYTYSVFGDAYWGAPAPFDHINCKEANSNIFHVEDGKVTYLYEIGGKVDSGAVEVIDNADGVFGEGDIVYWYSRNEITGGYIRHNHWGHVKLVNSDHPNQS